MCQTTEAVISLIAMGGGSPETVTAAAWHQLEEADHIIGAARLMEAIPSQWKGERHICVKSEDILKILKVSSGKRCVIYSGDTGFYSGCTGLSRRLQEEGLAYSIYPGLSSVQLLSGALGTPWQNWRLVSAHGVDCDPVAELTSGQPVFFLTGGRCTPQWICRQLTEAGLGELGVTVGEELSYPSQKLWQGCAEEGASRDFAPLSVLLTEPAPMTMERSHGHPDEAFLRGQVPMTKQEVRGAALGKLGVRPTDICWDIGAGTGSVSVELALLAKKGHVYAVEQGEEGCRLISENRKRFCAYQLEVIHGMAPDCICDLPAPDVVFVGGSKGNVREILSCAVEKNPNVRICVAAITIETLGKTCAALAELQIPASVVQISASRSRRVGESYLMTAQNPVFLITGNCL